MKQRGVVSPMFFAVYIDGLLKKSEKSRVGCYMGNKLMGGVSFVDIKILTPMHKGLNQLIYICEQYAAKYDIKFNGAKANIWYIKVDILLYITKMFL